MAGRIPPFSPGFCWCSIGFICFFGGFCMPHGRITVQLGRVFHVIALRIHRVHRQMTYTWGILGSFLGTFEGSRLVLETCEAVGMHIADNSSQKSDPCQLFVCIHIDWFKYGCETLWYINQYIYIYISRQKNAKSLLGSGVQSCFVCSNMEWLLSTDQNDWSTDGIRMNG